MENTGLKSLGKERPINESDKRFILSTEDFSRERLGAVRQEVDEIKSKYPEVLSLCLFGSMVKGTAHEGSDIDGYLFIDSALVAQKENMPEEDIIEQGNAKGDSYLKKEIATSYELELRKGIREKTGLDEEYVKHIRSTPISEKVIDSQINKAQEYYARIGKYKKDKEQYPAALAAWIKESPARGSEIDVLVAHEKNKPKHPSIPMDVPSTSLGLMFHLDVGGGIRKYRKMLIDKLVRLGPAGEKIWTDTIGRAESMENNLAANTGKRYPRTLAEAVEVYGK